MDSLGDSHGESLREKEKLTDRWSLALVDEFMIGLGFTEQLHQVFPSPGSGKGIKTADFIRTLVYHFVDRGRHLKEFEAIKTDEGFLSLIKLDQLPGSDAVGDWLRCLDERKGTSYVQRMNDTLVRRYVNVSKCKEFILDVDSTVIESNKGDTTYFGYKGDHGYHPMLGFILTGYFIGMSHRKQTSAGDRLGSVRTDKEIQLRNQHLLPLNGVYAGSKLAEYLYIFFNN